MVEWVESSVEIELRSDDGPDDTSDSSSADSSSGCDTHTKSAVGRVGSKTRLYEYKSSTYWCWDGTQITIDPNWTTYPYEYQIFEKFVEHTHTVESGGQGDLTHYDYTRGHFKSCLSWFQKICPFNFYPWVPWVEKQQHYDGDTWHRLGNG